jgi:hypothetical protein
MPIRINLLAEAQAAEELRRKDPVKRAIYYGAACVAVMAAVSVVVQSRVLTSSRQVAGLNDRIKAITNDYAVVMRDMERLRQVRLKTRGLDLLAAERFLQGSLLNALQQTTLDNVQLVRLRTEFAYTLVDESRAKTNTSKVLKPATAAERITLLIEARDSSANPGDQVARFRDALTRQPYLAALIGTNNEFRLINLAPPQIAPGAERASVQFTLESRLPEKIRNEISARERYAPVAPAEKPARASVNIARTTDQP